MIDTKTYHKIIQGLKDQDPDVMHHIYDLYADALYGIIVRVVKNEEASKDVLQNTFIKIWDNRQRFDSSKGRLFTWMMRIARNLSLNAIDKKSFKQSNKNQSLDSAVYIEEVNSSLDKADLVDLKMHIDSLDEKYAQVLELTFFEGHTQKDASEQLNIPLGTIKTRIRYALKELKKIYEFNNSKILVYFYIISFLQAS